MSMFNSHPPRKHPSDDRGTGKPGAMTPDNAAPKVTPRPKTPQHISQTDLDKERADSEGMTPNKPTTPAVP